MEVKHGGLSIRVPDSVYPPAEDSFLLADGAIALRGDVLEVGSGSGIASISCAKADKRNVVLGVDINPEAVECAKENAKANKAGNVSFRVGDLFSSVPKKKFDAIIFNPPYLPTEESELVEGQLNKAFDGGKDGRVVLERFLSQFDDFLKKGGILLLIQSSLNDKEKTVAMLESNGYSVQTIAEEKFFFERLFLLKAVKP